jgi:hypothetical protein
VGDLEVALEARDHQQLLELLRALRQGVDRARLLARGDDEITRPLGCRLDEQWRLDLEEAVGVMHVGDRAQQARPQCQALAHRLAPEVEIAVLEAEALVDLGVRLVDRKGRGLRFRQDAQVARPQLDLARRELRILGTRQAAGDLTLHAHRELRPKPARGRVHLRPLRPVDDDLGDPLAVADVEEDQLAEVAPPVDPARQANLRARVRGA